MHLRLVSGADPHQVAGEVGIRLATRTTPTTPAPEDRPAVAPDPRDAPSASPAPDAASPAPDAAATLPVPDTSTEPDAAPAQDAAAEPDAAPVQDTAPEPDAAPPVEGVGPPAAPPRTGRSGRVSVPAVSAPSVASTPAPRWLGDDPAARSEGSETAGGADDERVVVLPGSHDRLELRRVQVTTEGFSTVAEVLLVHGDVIHAGVDDAAATPAGAHRALAGATARCLESAAGGRLRVEVDGVQVQEVAGQQTAVVTLTLLSSRGQEMLSGAALVSGDPGRAVVHAVLAASNRRVALSVAEHQAQRA